jgi:hypothetical protein
MEKNTRSTKPKKGPSTFGTTTTNQNNHKDY